MLFFLLLIIIHLFEITLPASFKMRVTQSSILSLGYLCARTFRFRPMHFFPSEAKIHFFLLVSVRCGIWQNGGETNTKQNSMDLFMRGYQRFAILFYLFLFIWKGNAPVLSGPPGITCRRNLPRHRGRLHHSKLNFQRGHRGLIFLVTIKRIIYLFSVRNAAFQCCCLF